MDHTTGKGYVAEHKGHYSDALRKGHTVIPVIVEALGGIAPHSLAHIRFLARRSTGKGATDRTAYGVTRCSTKSFYTHHVQQISKAAVMYDAMAILKKLMGEKQKMCSNAADAAAGAVRA